LPHVLFHGERILHKRFRATQGRTCRSRRPPRIPPRGSPTRGLDVNIGLAGMSADGSRVRIRNSFRRTHDDEIVATVTSTVGWIDLARRHLRTPPDPLPQLLRSLPREPDYADLSSSVNPTLRSARLSHKLRLKRALKVVHRVASARCRYAMAPTRGTYI
jgi:hypothetical protein